MIKQNKFTVVRIIATDIDNVIKYERYPELT